MPRIAHKALATAVLVAACMLAGCSGGVPELDHAAKVGSMTAMVPSSYAEDAIENDLTYTDPHDSDRYISIVFDGDPDESVEQIVERELFLWSSEFDGGATVSSSRRTHLPFGSSSKMRRSPRAFSASM